jgi:predicted nucleic acid-binding protein
VKGAVLFDTNVISELIRPRPEARVLAFIDEQPDPYLSVLTLHELTWGAERVRDAVRRKKLVAWIAAIRNRFGGRLVDVDAAVAEHAGRLRASAATEGRVIDPMDSLIAASALSRGARVVTRNVRDFEPLGVGAIDPWATR